MKKILQRIALGIAIGCTVFVFFGFAVSLMNGAGTPFVGAGIEYIKSACCSMIICVGFTLPSIVYDSRKLARPMQILIHLSIGFIVLGLVAFLMGWISFPGKDVSIGMSGAWLVRRIVSASIFALSGIVVTAIIWLCFYLYYKNEAVKINNGIKKKQCR